MTLPAGVAGSGVHCENPEGARGAFGVPFVTDGDALLAAIRAQPEEDTPRLVFADWLDENGQHERAEFIRLQIEMTTADTRDWATLCEREQALFDRFARTDPEWCPAGWALVPWAREDTGVPLRPYRNPSGLVHRGFVRHLRCTLTVFLRDAAAIFAAHPVESVHVLRVTPFRRANGFECVLPSTSEIDPSDAADRFYAMLHRRPLRADHACETDARAELSARCVAFGRAEAARGAAPDSSVTPS